MSDSTTHLLLPYLAAAQAQKHVTHNEALRLLDGIVQLAVLDRDLMAPPASPADGARYIVASGATGVWDGWDLNIAYWVDGAWMRLVPREGWLAWAADEDLLLAFDGSTWSSVGGGSGVSLAALADGTVAMLGVNTAADATNRLAVRSNSVLFTAISAGDGGNGDMRYIVNKESTGDTASFLFQTSWSGRAEIGLMGSDLFGIKVSPDGSNWLTAVTMDASGRSIYGADAPRTVSGAVNPNMQVHGTNTNGAALGFTRWQNAAAGPTIFLSMSRGSEPGDHARPQAGDVLGALSVQASDGTLFVVGCDMRTLTEGDWSTNVQRKAGFELRTRDDLLSRSLYVGDNGRLEFPRIGTTSSAANAFLDSANSNRLLRSTSSGSYKTEVEDLAPAFANRALELRPVWYRSLAENDKPEWSWYGFVAEEVAAIEPRLVHWGYHDDDMSSSRRTRATVTAAS